MFVVSLDRPILSNNGFAFIDCWKWTWIHILRPRNAVRLPNKYGFGFEANIDSSHTFVWSNLADLARIWLENKIAIKKTATREEWMKRHDKNLLSWPENRSDANTFDLFRAWVSLDVYGVCKQNGLIKLDYHLSVADYTEGGSGASNEISMALMHWPCSGLALAGIPSGINQNVLLFPRWKSIRFVGECINYQELDWL